MQYTAIFHGSKNGNFQMTKCYVFLIFAQNIDCGYSLEPPQWCGSNEYPQSMFQSKNKKNNAYPCKPQFHYIKVGCKRCVHYTDWLSWWKLMAVRVIFATKDHTTGSRFITPVPTIVILVTIKWFIYTQTVGTFKFSFFTYNRPCNLIKA